MNKKQIYNDTYWSFFLVSFFSNYNIKYVCISPGARNSSLINAFTQNKNYFCISHVDERSSAYYALGIAKQTKQPVILLSTSGTAAANYLPAVIESSLSRHPLILLTADRPRYLINTGANQTIKQENLFGSHVRYSTSIGLPKNKTNVLEQKLLKSIKYASGDNKECFPPGPVHLNCPFEESELKNNNFEKIKFEKFDKKVIFIKPSIDLIKQTKRTLIIAGPQEVDSHQNYIVELSKKIKAPIFADPLSQIRYGYNNHNIITTYDIFLKCIEINPDQVLRFGRKPTSKILCKYLDKWNSKTIYIDDFSQFNDDSKTFIKNPILEYCQYQIKNINWTNDQIWTKKIIEYESSIKLMINNYIKKEKVFEGTIANICVNTLDNNDCLFIGNSMPIRDIDTFTFSINKKINVFGNRGASGIDGVISTALGISKGNNNSSNVLLIIGDMSFYHDMNGLIKSNNNLSIVVINNGGGGIFSFLPMSESKLENFEKYWIANTSVDFKTVAKLYNCKYFRVSNKEQLNEAIITSFKTDGIKIIEVKIEIKENVLSHTKLYNSIKRKLY
tara:strand:+ start:3162 stop:4841 length:1680 start_codon:yes stop_codon:yes gene_type:complete